MTVSAINKPRHANIRHFHAFPYTLHVIRALHVSCGVSLCMASDFITSVPKVKLTPRSFSPHPVTSLSGSDHKRSQSKPWSGTSVGRMILRICSIACKSGDRPPWQQKIFSSTEIDIDLWRLPLTYFGDNIVRTAYLFDQKIKMASWLVINRMFREFLLFIIALKATCN